MFSEKQAQLDLIQNKLKAQLDQKVSNEDERIKAAMLEKEAQKAAEEAEKAAKRAQTMQSIKEHRVQQVALNTNTRYSILDTFDDFRYTMLRMSLLALFVFFLYIEQLTKEITGFTKFATNCSWGGK